jgi:hypothetical protein
MSGDTERRAAEARALLDDPCLTAVLSEIEDEAKALFLASGGDPGRLTAAFEKVRAVQTLRAALKSRLLDHGLAVKREQKRQHRG